MTVYSENIVAKQTEKQIGKDQIKNKAGGYVYKANFWTVLDRFLIIGSEKNTYYASAKELTAENAENIIYLIKKDGKRVVNRIIEISSAGRSPKNDAALFALALCMKYGDGETRKMVADNLSKVARTGTHLFQFIEDVTKFRGWGRSLRRAVSNWYNCKTDNDLVYQLIKYKNREGWAHKDLISLSHVKPKNGVQNTIFSSIVNNSSLSNIDMNKIESKDVERFIVGNNFSSLVVDTNENKSINKAIKYIKTYNLPREVIPTDMLNNKKIWSALLENKMPMTAMLRNLGKMSSIGLLTPFSESEKIVIDSFNNSEYVKRSRIHPINVLMAKLVYDSGSGIKGNNNWSINTRISAALEDMFYSSFNNIEPTGLRYLNAIDVSGSMTCSIYSYPYLNSMTAMAAMSMSIIRSEENALTGVFTSNFKLININKKSSLNEICNKFMEYDFGATDIGSAIKYLIDNEIEVDVIFVGSDGETWAGDKHVDYLLNKYRNKFGNNTRLIVANTEANSTSLTEPNDKLSYNIAGFDSNLPVLVHEMSLGNI